MSVLRRVKLRTPDGIESIEYPLGVEAENVEVANGENLSQRLARINEDLENNEEDIAAVSELAGTNKQNIGANEIRIDALERRSASVDKKPYYFDTVADMKAYQGLKEGDMAITLGYYSANDGGNGEYIIINDSNQTADNGSIHDLSNGFKAELIVNNSINVKLFGAKGDGASDDTQFINNTFSYAETKTINYLGNQSRPSHFKVYFGSGNYIISNTIIMNVQRFDVEGQNAVITSNISDSTPAIHLIGGNPMSPDRVIKGITIINNTDNKTDTVGFYIGTTTYGGKTHEIPAAAFKMVECGATYFGTAYLISHNAYTFTLDNCGGYGNKYVIRTNGNLVNSGENIVINDCVFASTTDTDIVVTAPNIQLRFVNTSFDQGKRLIDINYPGSTYEANLITFDKCHFEPSNLTQSMIYINQNSSVNKIVLDKCTTFIDTSYQYLVENMAFASVVTILNTFFSFLSAPNFIANNERTKLENCQYSNHILADPYTNLFIDSSLNVTSFSNDILFTNGQSFCTNRCWIYLDSATYNNKLEKTSGNFVNLTIDTSIKPSGATKSFKVNVTGGKNNIIGCLAPYEGNNILKGNFYLYIPENVTGTLVIRGVYWDGANIQNIGYPGTIYSSIDLSSIEANTWIKINYPTDTFRVPTNAKYVGFMIENQGNNVVKSDYIYYFGLPTLQEI